MSNNIVPFKISRRKLEQENQALRQQIDYLLRQNNNLGRINVSALNCIERVENIIKGLQLSPLLPFLAILWRRLFLDLSVVIGQTSRFTIRDEKGNFLVKAEKMPDSVVVEKAKEENQDDEGQEKHEQDGEGHEQDESTGDAGTHGGIRDDVAKERHDTTGCPDANEVKSQAAEETVVKRE